MKYGSIVSSVMLVLSLGSAIGYAWDKDWPRSVYWIAAATITGVIPWMR